MSRTPANPRPPSASGGPARWLALGAAAIALVALIAYALRSGPDAAEDSAAASRSTAAAPELAGKPPVPAQPGAAAGSGAGAPAPGTAMGGEPPADPGAQAGLPAAAPSEAAPVPTGEMMASRSVPASGGAAVTAPEPDLAEARAALRAGGAVDDRLQAIDRLLDVATAEEPSAPVVSDAVESLAQAANDASPEVAEAAIDALGEIESPRSIGALGEILASNAPESVKLAAIDAITSLDAPGAARALSYALTDPSPDVREEAAWSLWWVEDRDPSALAALNQAASGERDEAIRDTMLSTIEDYQE